MKKSLLIVEGSSIMLKKMESMFNQSGRWSHILSARNGFDALDILHLVKPDIVCLGENLPIMDSSTVLNKIQELKRKGIIPETTGIAMMSDCCKDTIEMLNLEVLNAPFGLFPKPHLESPGTGSIERFEENLVSVVAS